MTEAQNRATRKPVEGVVDACGPDLSATQGATAFRAVGSAHQQTPESQTAEWVRWITSTAAVARPGKAERGPSPG
jgi:alkylated DNA nucleotide flippase Atl1